MEDINLLTHKIIGCCFEVHSELGPGFSEKIYHNALLVQLNLQDISYENEREFRVDYKDNYVGKFRCDLIINELVIVEIKAVTGIMPLLFNSQIISYLKASKTKTGLIINFGNESCEVKRVSL